uniref:uncharacterized protein isoform X1 n=2 Tax=Myxine glutinosa TaxID=7769 RepID=UPI00358EA710
MAEDEQKTDVAASTPKEGDEASPQEDESKVAQNDVLLNHWCWICSLGCTSEETLLEHRKGQKHRKAEAALGLGDKNKSQEGKPQTLPDQSKNVSLKDAVKGHAKLQEAKTHMLGDLLDNNATDEAIIGLSHIKEHLPDEGNTGIVYSCSLCGCKPSMHAHVVLSHIIGFKHRLNFLQRYYPSQLCADKYDGMPAGYSKHVKALAKEVQRLEGWSKHQIQSPSNSNVLEEIMKVTRMKDKGFVEQLKELAKHNEPAIGINHITEHLCKNNPSALPYYTCELCDVRATRMTILSHLIGFKHRENVVKQTQGDSIPKSDGLMRKSEKNEVLKKLCLEISKNEENPYSFEIVHEDQEKFAPPVPQPKTKEAMKHPLPHGKGVFGPPWKQARMDSNFLGDIRMPMGQKNIGMRIQAQMQGAFGRGLGRGQSLPQLLPHLPGFRQGLPRPSDLPLLPPRLQLTFDDFQQDSRKHRELQYQEHHRFESRMGDSNRNDYCHDAELNRRLSNAELLENLMSFRITNEEEARLALRSSKFLTQALMDYRLNISADLDNSDKGRDRPSNFPSDRPLNFPGDNPPSFPSDRIADFPSDRPPDFPGDRSLDFPVDRPPNFPVDRPPNFPGDRPLKFPGDRPLKFPGERPLKFPGDRSLKYPGDRVLNFPGDRTLSFPDDRTLSFPGDRALGFTGDRVVSFPGDRVVSFPGDRPLSFPGDRGLSFLGDRPPSLLNNTGPSQGNFLQQRVPSYSQSQLVPPMGFPSINTARNRFPNLP